MPFASACPQKLVEISASYSSTVMASLCNTNCPDSARERSLRSSIRSNTYLDDTLGKIVIYSWSMAARRGKSGKRCIFLTQRRRQRYGRSRFASISHPLVQYSETLQIIYHSSASRGRCHVQPEMGSIAM